ncbi:MAG: metalloregulator ArsR/SmtB family transcription factor [Pseudomonadales bacterium]|uniref:Regulatory protein ArsR n=1 Tax=Oleiphilus messinensis TaxID=141451 RepID=A0A1Y0IC72_9GAMM|nr:metalloregulator ArsR/SmtB family transcription factor [Oleiphilus messinensis]ARU56994.1 regulatory protein ArsR [Oleiphilus messinensis]MCG8610455.1 metalloregulator ArsR/SmtB family transcription factor [Pseudomonadales bacterium]
MPEQELSAEALELIAMRFKILGDPMRLKILHALQSGEKTVGELVSIVNANQPNISKHLSILRTAGLVKRRKESNLAYFTIGAPFVFELCEIVCGGIQNELNSIQQQFSQG